MTRNKITITDLIDNQNFKEADFEIETENNYKEKTRNEIENFIYFQRNKETQIHKENEFYNITPKTPLEIKVESILKKRSKEEIRENKNFQHQYSSKMQKVKRIKSKTYRRFKREAKKLEREENEQKENNNLINNVELKENEQINEEDNFIEEYENAPIFEFNGEIKDNKNKEIVKLAFENVKEENVKDFLLEKETIINTEAPSSIETILPGWGGWAGPGLKVSKTKYNVVVENKKGIKNSDRKDFSSSHVIINETKEKLDDKFKCKVPFGYTKEEYIEKLNRPISRECNTNKMFNKIIKDKIKLQKGKSIKPEKFNPQD